MLVQVVSVTGGRGPLTAHCRNQSGQYTAFRIGQRAIPHKYIWGGTGQPPKFTEQGRVIPGRSLISSDETALFREYTRSNKVHLDDGNWYDTRLRKYHRWCIENSHAPCGWFTIPAANYTFGTTRELNAARAPSMPPAPWKLACFDIETQLGPNGAFPSADTEQIIGISLVIDNGMFTPGSPREHHVFTLGSCGAFESVDDQEHIVHECSTERVLIQEFCETMVLLDPDVISGWNTDGFDWP